MSNQERLNGLALLIAAVVGLAMWAGIVALVVWIL